MVYTLDLIFVIPFGYCDRLLTLQTTGYCDRLLTLLITLVLSCFKLVLRHFA